jgi:hypothetical protein
MIYETFPTKRGGRQDISWIVSNVVLTRTIGNLCLPRFRRARDPAVGRFGCLRVMYITALVDAVYVLHAFQKKTQQMAKHDVDLAAARFGQITGRRSK